MVALGAGALMLVPSPWLAPALAATAVVALGLWRARRLSRARADGDGGPTWRWGWGRRATAGLPADAVGLGRESPGGRAVALSGTQLAAHGLIVGASGAGKSTTLLRLLTERIAQGLPVVALDLKGSPAFARTLAEAAAAAKRPFALWSLDGPAGWNPLAHGNPTELKDKLIATERFTEPHYQRAAEHYLLWVLRVLSMRGAARPPTLAEVVALGEPRRLAAAARGLPEPMASRLEEYLSSRTPDQLSAIRGLTTRLALITESHVGRYLHERPGRPVVDLRAALRGDQVVVFSLNSSTYGLLAAQIGTVVVQDLMGAAGARLAFAGPAGGVARPAGGAAWHAGGAAGSADGAAELYAPGVAAPRPGGIAAGAPLPALVGIDEFSALGAQQILGLFARGREAGVSVLLATQELADLDRSARGLRDQILGNTTVKIIHRQDVPGSARLAAQMAGTRMVWDEVRAFGPTASLWDALVPRGSRRAVERFRVHPDTIASLPTGRALLITKAPASTVRMVAVSPPRRGMGVASARVTADQGQGPASGHPPAGHPRSRGAARPAVRPTGSRPGRQGPPPRGPGSRRGRNGPER